MSIVDETEGRASKIVENLKRVLGRRTTRVFGLVALLTVVVIALFAFLNWYIAPTKPGDRKDLVLALAQILGGAALLSGLYFTWRTLQVNREGQITERFTRAIDQLGETDHEGKKLLEVRLGGIYALGRIANDSEADYWSIMEVLASYVRQHAPWRSEEYQSEGSAAEVLPLDSDIRAIMTVIGRRTRSYPGREPQPIDLGETNFRGAYFLEGMNLEAAYLMDANLQEAELRKACLIGVNLGRSNLRRAGLPEADLERANLEGANLEGANLEKANLEKANLKGANLERANLRGTNVKGANLTEAHLTGADLEEADFEEADLTIADLSEANSVNVNLSNAQLRGARLVGARLGYANLTGTTLIRADLTGTQLKGANLSKAMLRQADLEEADLRQTNLAGAYLRHTNLAGAYLMEANLMEADLLGANLEGANLKGTHLERATLTEANLKVRLLEEAHLEGADLRGASGPTQNQLEQAYGDESTQLSAGLAVPVSWLSEPDKRTSGNHAQ